jgi:hypothetical protein
MQAAPVTVRVTISMPRDLSGRVERYWHDRGLSSYSEAIRMLIEKALPTDDPSRFFEKREMLVNRGAQRQFTVPAVPLLYLRLMPGGSPPHPLKRADAYDLIRSGPESLLPFYYRPGSSFEPNEYGAIAFDANYNDGQILCAAQLFLTREIWGFNATLFNPDAGRKQGIPTLSVEQTFAVCLPKYAEFAVTKLALEPPFIIEAGAAGLKGLPIFMPSNYLEQEWGPIQQDNVRWSGELRAVDAASIDAVLLSIFEEFFDAGGVRRPPNLYGFPGSTPGVLPQR